MTLEELFKKQNPQDGELPPWAKRLAETYAAAERSRILSQAGVLTDWTEVQPDGCVHVPDELDPLVNKIAIQMRFHTISGKSEGKTVCDIAYIAQVFFHKHLTAALLRQREKHKYLDHCVEEAVAQEKQRHDREMEEFAEWMYTNPEITMCERAWHVYHNDGSNNTSPISFAALLARFREKDNIKKDATH